jgi:hypothetical protein
MAGLDPKGWRLICLKGNHEDIMWQTCRRKVPDCDWWLTNGGGATTRRAVRSKFWKSGSTDRGNPTDLTRQACALHRNARGEFD